MKKYIILLSVLLLSACSTTTPVARKFPEHPGKISMENCPKLQKLEEDAKLSDVAKIVASNYGTYYECSVKVDSWIEWYNIQKNIFESVK